MRYGRDKRRFHVPSVTHRRNSSENGQSNIKNLSIVLILDSVYIILILQVHLNVNISIKFYPSKNSVTDGTRGGAISKFKLKVKNNNKKTLVLTQFFKNLKICYIGSEKTLYYSTCVAIFILKTPNIKLQIIIKLAKMGVFSLFVAKKWEK